jgi:RNA polymerase sigma-70 factor (ECF subfamily)
MGASTLQARMIVDQRPTTNRAGNHGSSPKSHQGVDRRTRVRFRCSDPDAVRAVYRTYGQLVFAVAFSVLGDRALCEEATQQTFVKAWRAAGSVDPNRDLGPWLATIARRAAIDLYRHEARRRAGPLDAVPPDHPALAAAPMTDRCLDVWEVRRAVSELPLVEREVVRLQHFEGLGHGQIAERLGVPIGTVKSRSSRAHRRLAAELAHLRAKGARPSQW